MFCFGEKKKEDDERIFFFGPSSPFFLSLFPLSPSLSRRREVNDTNVVSPQKKSIFFQFFFLLRNTCIFVFAFPSEPFSVCFF